MNTSVTSPRVSIVRLEPRDLHETLSLILNFFVLNERFSLDDSIWSREGVPVGSPP